MNIANIQFNKFNQSPHNYMHIQQTYMHTKQLVSQLNFDVNFDYKAILASHLLLSK